jgi:xanthine dehydrogenase YagR molybdenum-binding subunit
VLPFVVDADAALATDARGDDGVGRDGGPAARLARGFAAADVVVEETYRTPCQLHTTMEPHGSVAKWDGPRLTVWDTTQGVFDRQQELARALALPLTNVRVLSPYMGGGFGSKLVTGKYTVIAALLARATGRRSSSS